MKIWKKWWFWAIVVVALISAINTISSDPDTEPQKETNTSEKIIEPTTVEPSETAKTEAGENVKTEEPETAAGETNTEDKTNISAYQLVTMEGHPVLYDYLSSAHTFWDDYADGRIDFPDDYFDDYERGKTALIIFAYRPEHMIRKFEIYPDEEISLDEGLNLAKSYLPMDILKKWYVLKRSECYFFEKDNEYWYSLLYVPTESGEKSIEESGLDYNYAEVFIYVKNDIVTTICISSTSQTPNTGRDYEIKEWTHDFLD